jgi:hypothetical protein
MTPADTDMLIRQFLGGDPAATRTLAARAERSTDPVLLVAAALAGAAVPDLLVRAAMSAATTRDRQLVAVAAAFLAGDTDRVDALAREHLVEHPDNMLVAWVADASKILHAHDRTRETP